MQFRIADSFTASLARLTAEEQKAVKTAAFDLQMDPANPGYQFHRVDRARDNDFWSVRVSSDIRLIVHRRPGSLLLCYVGHHDDAYGWAERRKLEIHPSTGAAQMVEIQTTVRRVEVPLYVAAQREMPPLPRVFEAIPEDTLLGYGVPPEWLADVRAADENTILDLAQHLPAEAAEALLSVAVGENPSPAPARPAGGDPFEHPDARRRFRVVSSVEELQLALEYPWERWSVFLHHEQRALIERDFNGPARVAGSAGTGKTVVALHRAAHLARANPDARVILATFSEPLANALRLKLRRLVAGEPRLGERLEVFDMATLARRLYALNVGPQKVADATVVAGLIDTAQAEVQAEGVTRRFLLTEWDQVVDAWQLQSWDSYRDVPRLGRKTRLPESRRRSIWDVYERVLTRLSERGMVTEAQMFGALAALFARRAEKPFEFAVVDEAQDLTATQLRFLAALAGDRPNGLFFAGDLGQRIFQQPFSWSTLGVEIRGRSTILRVNYRTSHQIRTHADRLLGPEISDVDGNVEARRGTVSVFNGEPPEVQLHDSERREIESVGEWLRARSTTGIAPEEMAVFVRSEEQLGRAHRAVEAAGLQPTLLDDRAEPERGHVAVGIMHRAKGLEFKAVAVMACDDEVLPLQGRIETAAEESDLREVYDTERHLLYVACTRTRDFLLVSGVQPASEFLGDFACGGASASNDADH